MAAVNAIIHLGALVGLGVLVWALLRVQREKRLLLSLVASTGDAPERIVVDWPLRFVRRFADACGIPWEGLDARLPSAKPRRIKGRILAQLLAGPGIAYVRYDAAAASGAGCLELVVRTEHATTDEWTAALGEALQMNTRVTYAPYPGSPSEAQNKGRRADQ